MKKRIKYWEGFNLCIRMLLVTIIFLLTAGAAAIAANYPDMPVVNDATCWKCHPTFLAVANGPNSGASTPPVLGGGHPISTNCTNRCHTSYLANVPSFQKCTYCHYDNYPPGYPKYMSYRHTSDGAYAFANIVSVRHSVYNIHLSSTTGCESCHLRALTAEHYRRTDRNGNRMDCNSCHTAAFLGKEVSTNQTLKIVKTAPYQIQYSNTWYAPAGTTVSRVYVDYLLDSSSYIELYALYNNQWGLVYGRNSGTAAKWLDLPAATTSLKTKIHSPYASSLPYSYLDVPKVTLTPSGAEYEKIQRAIANHDTSCNACHGQAHNISLTEDIPADIPKYTGLNWTTPLPVKIWKGESWVQSELVSNGHVIVSNRDKTITADAVWNYYKTAMASAGWVLNSAEPSTADGEFKVTYAKAGRTCIIWYHSKEDHTKEGPVGIGSKVEIMYN